MLRGNLTYPNTALILPGKFAVWESIAFRPGIIITPLANDELTGPRGAGYRRMIDLAPAKRARTPDEVANVAALLMGPDGSFITSSDFLIDGGVTSWYWYRELAPQ